MRNSTAYLKQTGGRRIGRVVYDAETLARRVAAMACDITDFYGERELLVLGLLKGSFVFLSDLVRRLQLPLQVDFLVAASYGNGKASSGDVHLLYSPETALGGKHILLVEDIIDTGRTLECLLGTLQAPRPASLEVCALLHKRRAASLPIEPRFIGFDAPSAFLVGYGLDHAENFRHLPFIGTLP